MACEGLHAFVDGELSAEEAHAFRRHLAECGDCQHGLSAVLQLGALVRSAPRSAGEPPESVGGAGGEGKLRVLPGGRDVIRSRDPRRRLYVPAFVAAFAVAAAAVAVPLILERVRSPGSANHPSPIAIKLDPTRRPMRPRLTVAPFDAHREFIVSLGDEHAGSTKDWALLDRLDKAGDVRGRAAVLVESGDFPGARKALATPRTLDERSDQAALLLQHGEADQALALTNEVLEEAPRHPQALFNRALALEQLGRAAPAAAAFDQAAALAEPGWSDEARVNAERLRQALQDRP